MIDDFAFGTMVIQGRRYTSDLIIYPDGKVRDNWWRKNGHRLSSRDIDSLVDASPDIIIVGTGMNGLMRADGQLGGLLAQRGIALVCEPNARAVAHFNRLVGSSRVGACFHLTC
jgi:hypothetical protein